MIRAGQEAESILLRVWTRKGVLYTRSHSERRLDKEYVSSTALTLYTHPRVFAVLDKQLTPRRTLGNDSCEQFYKDKRPSRHILANTGDPHDVEMAEKQDEETGTSPSTSNHQRATGGAKDCVDIRLYSSSRDWPNHNSLLRVLASCASGLELLGHYRRWTLVIS